ncbi:MAG: mechanosensitive ion channel family protein [Dehalococcoidia bacterium]
MPRSTDEWQDWLIDDAPKLAVVLVLVVLVHLTGPWVVSRILRGLFLPAAKLRGDEPQVAERRLRTLQGTLRWAITTVAAFIGIAVVLAAIGLDIVPLVAGVGVVGLAIGLGAQTLIKDVINGIFIIAEEQFAVGDQVTVAGVTGEVMDINPRRTLLRDGEGNVHTVPNGSITTATNRTPGLGRVRIEVEVPFRESEAALAALEAAFRGSGALAAKIAATRVVASGDVRVLVVAEAPRDRRWAAEAELRRRLKQACDNAKVGATFPGA